MQSLRECRLYIPDTYKDYPDYDDWLPEKEAQFRAGEANGTLAYDNRRPIGGIAYKEDASDSGIVFVRAVAINPDNRGYYVGSHMLAFTEVKAIPETHPRCEKVIVDTKVGSLMEGFLRRRGYQLVDIIDKYGLGGGLGLEQAAGLVAVHPRHHHVERDQLGLELSEEPEALRGSLGFALDMEAELGQMMADDFPRERRVIYDQRYYGHG